MSVAMPINRLMTGVISTVQRGGHTLPQQQEPSLPHKIGSAAGIRLPLPVEYVSAGDVLDRNSTLNRGAPSFHATGRYLTASAAASGGVTPMAQRAIAEYQSFALVGKGRPVPPHNVDEYA
jgi:hypothetical protein